MIAYSDNENYLYIVQAMIDLDFEGVLNYSLFERTRGMIPAGPWEVN